MNDYLLIAVALFVGATMAYVIIHTVKSDKGLGLK